MNGLKIIISKMKNRVLYTTVLTMLLFPSCKKDRQCKCVITYGNGNEQKEDILYKKVTKREVKILCKDYESSSSSVSHLETHCRIE
jgi:hypothetical protein